jgi:Biotin-requiring enzyme
LESLGDSITSAVLLSWAKEIGDSIKEDDVIAIVETDKVSAYHRHLSAGIIVFSRPLSLHRHYFHVFQHANYSVVD